MTHNATNTQLNLLTAPGRGNAPIVDRERHIQALRRSIAALEDAGLPTTFYAHALAALEGEAK